MDSVFSLHSTDDSAGGYYTKFNGKRINTEIESHNLLINTELSASILDKVVNWLANDGAELMKLNTSNKKTVIHELTHALQEYLTNSTLKHYKKLYDMDGNYKCPYQERYSAKMIIEDNAIFFRENIYNPTKKQSPEVIQKNLKLHIEHLKQIKDSNLALESLKYMIRRLKDEIQAYQLEEISLVQHNKRNNATLQKINKNLEADFGFISSLDILNKEYINLSNEIRQINYEKSGIDSSTPFKSESALSKNGVISSKNSQYISIETNSPKEICTFLKEKYNYSFENTEILSPNNSTPISLTQKEVLNRALNDLQNRYSIDDLERIMGLLQSVHK